MLFKLGQHELLVVGLVAAFLIGVPWLAFFLGRRLGRRTGERRRG